MKKATIGIVLLIVSVFMYLALTISAAFLASDLSSWYPELSRFQNAIREYSLGIPLGLSYLLMAASLAILAREYFDKPKKENDSSKEYPLE